MNDPTPNVDPKNKGRVMYDEADIGSGERSPGQHETDEMIRGIPALPAEPKDGADKDEAPQEKRREPGA